MSSDSDEESIETIKVSDSQALQSIGYLQRYYRQKGINYFDESLSQMQSNVTNITFKSLKQSKIDDFFTPKHS